MKNIQCFAFWLCILSLFPTDLQAEKYFIFQFYGDVHILRENRKIVVNEKQSIQYKDKLVVKNGWVCLIDLNNKRVTIQLPETYTYDQIQKKFLASKESIWNKLLNDLYYRINKSNEDKTSVVAGVIRGDDVNKYLVDSLIILTNYVTLKVKNNSADTLRLTLKSVSDEMYAIETLSTDSLFIIKNDLGWCHSGYYIWDIQYSNKNSIKGFFIIPNEFEKRKYLEDIKDIEVEFSELPKNIVSSIIDEYAFKNRLFIN